MSGGFFFCPISNPSWQYYSSYSPKLSQTHTVSIVPAPIGSNWHPPGSQIIFSDEKKLFVTTVKRKLPPRERSIRKSVEPPRTRSARISPVDISGKVAYEISFITSSNSKEALLIYFSIIPSNFSSRTANFCGSFSRNPVMSL